MLGDEVRIISLVSVIILLCSSLAVVYKAQELLRQARSLEVSKNLEEIEIIKLHGKKKLGT
jgi:hypothetical protein